MQLVETGSDAVMTDAGGRGPAPEQLCETLGKNTITEKEEAAGISGYSNTNLLLRKKPRLYDQVQFPRALDAAV